MNSYLALRKASFCVAYKDVGEGREQEALSFTNFLNSLLLRAIRCLESEFSEYNLLRPELIRASLNKKLNRWNYHDLNCLQKPV